MCRLDKFLGSIIVLAALGMAGWASYTAARWALSYRWPAVPCVIRASHVKEVGGDNPYVFEVAYRYAFRGQPFVGEVYREDYTGSWDIAGAERLHHAYPAGGNRVCYVNPSDPDEAILEHDNVLLPIVAAIGLLFSGAFLAGVFILPGHKRIVEGMGSFFILVMGFAGYACFFAMPLSTCIRSLAWEQNPCVVETAEIRSVHRGGVVPHEVYWPDIVYRYEVDGVSHRANTYNASDVGSPWYYGSRGIVRRHPPGMRTTCYVDPSDPFEAVLVRKPSSTQWYGVWPLIMGGIGAVGAVRLIFGREPRFGSLRGWGTLALWSATSFALLILIETGGDLIRDRRAGIAESAEYIVVAIAGLVSAVLLLGWIALAIGHGKVRRERVIPMQRPGVRGKKAT